MRDEFGNVGVRLTPGDAVESQDELFEAATDLDRLAGLLEDAARQLMRRFAAAGARIDGLDADNEVALGLRRELGGAAATVQLVRRHCPVARREIDAASAEIF